MSIFPLVDGRLWDVHQPIEKYMYQSCDLSHWSIKVVHIFIHFLRPWDLNWDGIATKGLKCKSFSINQSIIIGQCLQKGKRHIKIGDRKILNVGIS